MTDGQKWIQSCWSSFSLSSIVSYRFTVLFILYNPRCCFLFKQVFFLAGPDLFKVGRRPGSCFKRGADDEISSRVTARTRPSFWLRNTESKRCDSAFLTARVRIHFLWFSHTLSHTLLGDVSYPSLTFSL